MTNTNYRTYHAVLFDLDGTFVDTAPDFVRAGNQLRKDYGMQPLPAERISQQVSNGAAAVTALCLETSVDDPAFDSQRNELLDHYEAVLGQHSSIYTGLLDYTEQLASLNKPWGIVTNKPLRYAAPLLEQLNLKKCSTLVCPDHVINKKPDPESLYKACKNIEVEPQHCIYVGDHQRDVEAGRSASMLTIAAAYGYIADGDNPDNWGADHIANTSSDLAALLYQLTAA